MDKTKPILVTVAEFGEYDNRRYGRPWLAKLKDIPGSVKLSYEFVEGAFAESAKGGVLMAYLAEGDYIAYGQKDFRGRSSFTWYGIFLDGRLQEVSKSEIVHALSTPGV